MNRRLQMANEAKARPTVGTRAANVLNRAETVTAVNNVHLRPNVSRVETTNISAGNSVMEAIVNVLNTSRPRASRHLMCPS